MMKRRVLLLSCLFLAGCGTADMETGKRAYSHKDYETAALHFRQLADFGIPEAQARLARQYMQGKGVEQDAQKALTLFEQAEEAERGTQYARDISQAKVRLAARAVGGKPVNGLSPTQALQILEEAAAENNKHALFELGLAYEHGRGVAVNIPRALEYYARSAEQGYGRAAYQRANIYEKGNGVPKNIPKAMELYQSAADKGYMKARLKLTILREKEFRQGPEKSVQNAASATKFAQLR